jgi:hypothetical protein
MASTDRRHPSRARVNTCFRAIFASARRSVAATRDRFLGSHLRKFDEERSSPSYRRPSKGRSFALVRRRSDDGAEDSFEHVRQLGSTAR